MQHLPSLTVEVGRGRGRRQFKPYAVGARGERGADVVGRPGFDGVLQRVGRAGRKVAWLGQAEAGGRRDAVPLVVVPRQLALGIGRAKSLAHQNVRLCRGLKQLHAPVGAGGLLQCQEVVAFLRQRGLSAILVGGDGLHVTVVEVEQVELAAVREHGAYGFGRTGKEAVDALGRKCAAAAGQAA